MAQLIEQLEVFGPKLIVWMQGFFEGVWRLLRTGKLADFFDNWLFYAFVLALVGFLLDQVLYFWRHGESTLPVKIWQFIAQRVRKACGARQAAYEQGEDARNKEDLPDEEEPLYEEDLLYEEEPQTQRREAEAAFWSATRTLLRPEQEDDQMDDDAHATEPMYEDVYDEAADFNEEAPQYDLWEEPYTEEVYDEGVTLYEQPDALREAAAQEEWADDLTQQAEDPSWAQPEQLAREGEDLDLPVHTVRADEAEVWMKEESTDV